MHLTCHPRAPFDPLRLRSLSLDAAISRQAAGLPAVPQLVAAVFEKDDDSNHHIDFISCAAVLCCAKLIERALLVASQPVTVTVALANAAESMAVVVLNAMLVGLANSVESSRQHVQH